MITNPSARISEALIRADRHDESRPSSEQLPAARKLAVFTIALSREAGARGTTVARAVGARLGWPVYDNELLELIATKTNVRIEVLRRLDERPNSRLLECFEGFGQANTLSEAAFVHRLAQILRALGAGGACLIVGRGAAHILPAESTLRVRLLAERPDRIQIMAKEWSVTPEEAARRIDEVDRARVRFIRDHFGKDPSDPQNYDLVLNTSRFPVEDCADLIMQALHRLAAAAGRPTS